MHFSWVLKVMRTRPESLSLLFNTKIADEPPKKRRKTRDTNWEDEGLQFNDGYAMSDLGMNVGMDMDTGMYGGGEFVVKLPND